MVKYNLDVLSHHQSKILFLPLAHDLETAIDFFLWQKNMILTHNHYKSLLATGWIFYYLFIRFPQVLTNWKMQGSDRVSDTGSPTRDYFDKISNEITSLNTFPICLPIINFELKIENCPFAPNIQQDILIDFI